MHSRERKNDLAAIVDAEYGCVSCSDSRRDGVKPIKVMIQGCPIVVTVGETIQELDVSPNGIFLN